MSTSKVSRVVARGVCLSGRELPADLQRAAFAYLSLRELVRLQGVSDGWCLQATAALRLLDRLRLPNIGGELSVAIQTCTRIRVLTVLCNVRLPREFQLLAQLITVNAAALESFCLLDNHDYVDAWRGQGQHDLFESLAACGRTLRALRMPSPTRSSLLAPFVSLRSLSVPSLDIPGPEWPKQWRKTLRHLTLSRQRTLKGIHDVARRLPSLRSLRMTNSVFCKPRLRASGLQGLLVALARGLPHLRVLFLRLAYCRREEKQRTPARQTCQFPVLETLDVTLDLPGWDTRLVGYQCLPVLQAPRLRRLGLPSTTAPPISELIRGLPSLTSLHTTEPDSAAAALPEAEDHWKQLRKVSLREAGLLVALGGARLPALSHVTVYSPLAGQITAEKIHALLRALPLLRHLRVASAEFPPKDRPLPPATPPICHHRLEELFTSSRDTLVLPGVTFPHLRLVETRDGPRVPAQRDPCQCRVIRSLCVA